MVTEYAFFKIELKYLTNVWSYDKSIKPELWFFFIFYCDVFVCLKKYFFSRCTLSYYNQILYFFLHASAVEKREFRKLIQYQFIIKKMRFETVDLSIFSWTNLFWFHTYHKFVLNLPQKWVLSELNNSINCLQVFLTATDVGQEDNLFKKWNYYRQ